MRPGRDLVDPYAIGKTLLLDPSVEVVRRLARVVHLVLLGRLTPEDIDEGTPSDCGLQHLDRFAAGRIGDEGRMDDESGLHPREGLLQGGGVGLTAQNEVFGSIVDSAPLRCPF